MSDWVQKEAFEKFVEGLEKEQEQQSNQEYSWVKWLTPEKGTADRPKIYEGRFLQDPTGIPYKRYYYHMFPMGESWKFVLCDKTFDFETFCPWCTATQKLYAGTQADKSRASVFKRKEKFVGNFYVVNDPRDAEREADKALSNTVWLYEFPGKVESKVKNELTDKKNGLGLAIFDPSEGGYNFILKVKATKPQGDGKVWPDYSDCVFARKSEALGPKSQLKNIMDSRHNIMDYLDAMRVPDEVNIDLLKSEMLWEEVEKDWGRAKGTTAYTPREPDPDPQSPEPEENKSSGSLSSEDARLLEELAKF